MSSEAKIQNEIRSMLARRGVLVWRANVGSGWTGRATRIPGRVVIDDPRPLSTGLPPGFSDLFGLLPSGRFLAIEVKTPTGRVSPQQAKFLAAVTASGGLALVARSVQDVTSALEREEQS